MTRNNNKNYGQEVSYFTGKSRCSFEENKEKKVVVIVAIGTYIITHTYSGGRISSHPVYHSQYNCKVK